MEFLTFLKDIVKPTKNGQNLVIQNKNQNIMYLDTNNLYSYTMSKFPPVDGFKWIEPKGFDVNK